MVLAALTPTARAQERPRGWRWQIPRVPMETYQQSRQRRIDARMARLRDFVGSGSRRAIFAARREAALLRASARASGISSRAMLAPTLKKSDWNELGPFDRGGRVRALVIDAYDQFVMWLGTAGGGLWKTTDGGKSWKPVDTFESHSPAVSSIVMYQKVGVDNVLYAGTGEGFNNADAILGAGIFESTDDGKTWKLLPETDPAKHAEFHYVNRLAITSDGKTLYAATTSRKWGVDGLYYRKSGGTFSVAKYSTDGGSTFLPFKGLRMMDVKAHPSDPKKAIATSTNWSSSNGTAYYTTDGPEKWMAATFVPAVPTATRIELTYAAANPDKIVYASFEDGANRSYIYRSNDGGKTYTATTICAASTPAKFLNGQGWYANALWAGHPSKPEWVIVGGFNLHLSKDSGDSFQEISDFSQFPKSPHADQHFIVSRPLNSNVVFVGNDGGVYEGKNLFSTPSWTVRNTGLNIFQVEAIAAVGGGIAASPATLVAGHQDNDTYFKKVGLGFDWTKLNSGSSDGGYCAIDPTNPNRIYGEYAAGPFVIFRTLDGGKTTTDLTSGSNPAETLPAYPVLVHDPNQGNLLLLGGPSLWKTTNPSATSTAPVWVSIKSPITGATPFPTPYITAIAVAPGNSDLIWVGDQNGTLFKTTNGTAASPHWDPVPLKVGGTVVTPARACSRIVFDPIDPAHTVYAAFSGYQKGNLLKTTNGGTDWVDLSGSLLPKAPVPVHALAIHPAKPKILFVGTEVGLFTSDDGGSSWSATEQGPAIVPVYDLVVAGFLLYAGTHGRGTWSLELAKSLPPPPSPPTCKAAFAGGMTCPLPAMGLRQRVLQAARGEIGIVKSVYDAQGHRQGWPHLVDYYQKAYREEYNPRWEPELKRPTGRVGEWDGVFAVWAVNKAGRDDVRWKIGRGIVGLPLVWRKDASLGDIVVARTRSGGSRFAILEFIDAEGFHVISGDYVWGTVGRRVFRATDVGAYYPVEPPGA
jgi:photosystem II stability/assembly factor-like uncharacterized protein